MRNFILAFLIVSCAFTMNTTASNDDDPFTSEGLNIVAIRNDTQIRIKTG